MRSPLTTAARGLRLPAAAQAGALSGASAFAHQDGQSRQHETVHSFSSAFRPDMAAIGAVVALFYAIFLFQGYSAFFRDSDTGWHIRTGEMILKTSSLPHADPYSFSRPGQPWLAWEWLSDVLMGAVHQTSGLAGIAMLYGLAIAASVWLWFRLNWDAGGNFLLACALASPMLSTCNLHWLARPHVISWLFFLGAVRFSERLKGPLTKTQAAGVAVVAALWTNIHGSFFFAPLIPLIWALGIWLSSLIWSPVSRTDTEPRPSRAGETACATLENPEATQRSDPEGTPDEPSAPHGAETAATQPGQTTQNDGLPYGVCGRLRPLLQTAVIAAAATLLNPYGWQLHLHVARYLSDHELLDRVGEFESFNFHAAGALPITIGLAIAMAGAVFSLARHRVEHFFFSALLVVAALRSARGLPLVALLALPLANGAITESLAAARGLKPPIRRFLDGFLAYGKRLRTLDSRNNGFALVTVCCLLFAVMLKAPGIAAHTGFPPDQFPVAAASTVAGLPLQARIFAPDKFGGYLIYKFNGVRKVFFDGRSDFYGAGFLKDYGRIVQVRPGWQSLFAPFHCNYALLPKDYSLIGVLKQQGWRQLYYDSTVELLGAPGEGAQPAPSQAGGREKN